MKTIRLLTLALFNLICSYSYAQNLQFNSAVFREYSVSNVYASNLNIISIGTLQVGPNQVLKITSCGGSATISSQSFIPTGYISINQRVIARSTDTIELYMPSGTYDIGFRDSNTADATLSVKGYISGVLYDIVP